MSFRWVPPSYGSLNRKVSPGARPPSRATLAITARTANAMAPTKIGSPLVPWTSVSPVSAWYSPWQASLASAMIGLKADR